MKKIIFIFGTRPEFIKIYPVMMEFKKHTDNYKVIVVNTGQHKEMVNQLLDQFNFSVDYDLEIMNKCNGLMDILTVGLQLLDEVVKSENPDMIMVHGDTSATLAGSITAFYNQVPLSHIEAGLRTYNKYSPFPEEMNRQMTGVIADVHFTPTETTKQFLLNEAKKEESIHVVGNSAIDMLKYTIDEKFTHKVLDSNKDKKIILVTVHRRENLEKLKEIFEAFNEITLQNPDYVILYPIHLNPVIRKIANETIETNENIQIIEPLDPVTFHNIMKKAEFILTDSGGIQEEAPSLGKPVLVMRDTTERPEGVEAGTLKLVGTDGETMIKEANKLINDVEYYNNMANVENPYGTGNTSEMIVEVIDNLLGE